MPGIRPRNDRSAFRRNDTRATSQLSFVFDLILFFGFCLDLKADNARSGEPKLRARRTQIV